MTSCDKGGDCECLCTAIAAYSMECARKSEYIFWRSQELCGKSKFITLKIFYKYKMGNDITILHFKTYDKSLPPAESSIKLNSYWILEYLQPRQDLEV